MSDFIKTTISGEKFGSGGASSFKTKPDTLRSNDSFEVLLGLGSGRWKGLVNGLQSLKINGVQLEDEDGESNFEDFNVIFADGDPAQVQHVNFKLGGGGSTTSVNTIIENSFVSAAVSTPGADFIDIRLVISSLYRQDKKGIGPTTMTLELEMRPSGASDWINPLLSSTAPTGYHPSTGVLIEDGYGGDVYFYKLSKKFNEDFTEYEDANPGKIVITDKTTSPAIKELRIAVPNTGNYEDKTWQVRIKMIEEPLVQEGDDGEIEERRTVSFESIAAVVKTVFGDDPAWSGLVWLQVVGKATDQLNGFPSIVGIYDTKIVKVPPSNIFDPDTREYSEEIWDGSYVNSYTNDPAWCIKDLIEDPISGIAALSPGATLDKWDALEASKYFSELVSDGLGGEHSRFSMNIRIDKPQNAEELIQYLAGAVNSIAVDTGGGKWRMKVDKPETPVAIFTTDNIFGEFEYNHTDMDSRFNDFTAVFQNEENDYQEDRVRVFDQDNIDLYGRKPTTIVAVGATNRQEVLRRLMYRLRVSLNETRMVKFMTNRLGKLYEPLQTILIADQSLGYLAPDGSEAELDFDETDNRTTSRVIEVDAGDRKILTLGRSIRLEPGVSYSITTHIPNPDYDPSPSTQPDNDDITKPTLVWTSNIDMGETETGDVSTIVLENPMPTSAPEMAVIALSAIGLPTLPITYRILEINSSAEREEVGITAVIVDTGKWTAADEVEEDEILGQQSSPLIPPPTDIDFSVAEFNTEFMPKRVLTVTWVRPATLWLDGFKVEYRLNGGNWQILQALTVDSYVELQQPQNGFYDFRIVAIDRRGPVSGPLMGTYELEDIGTDSPTPHTYGLAADLPDDPTFEGEKYTATDTGITYTSIDGIWVATDSLGAPEGTFVAGLAAETLIANIDDLEATVDGKITVFYQGSTPTAEAEGDLWFDTDIDKWYIWESGAWLQVEDAGIGQAISDAAGAQATADGKVVTFYQDATPTAEGVGDLWIRPSDAIKVVKRWNGTTWEEIISTWSGLVAYLTNESHTVPADAAGTVSSYSGATGSFKVYNGLTDVSASFALSTQSNPQSLTVGYVGQAYTITAGLDAGEDLATLTIRATGSGTYSGVTLDKVFSLGKSKTGSTGGAGADAKLMTIYSDRQTIAYDTAGSSTPSTQTTTFGTNKINTTATVNWSITDASGNAMTPTTTYLSAATGNSITMTEAQFAAARNGTSGVIVTATLTDGVTLTDKISVTRVQQGATGATGTAAIVGFLTNESHVLPADSAGNVGSYTGATGSFKVYSGQTDVSSSFALSTQSNPQSLTIGYVSQAYTVTAGLDAGEDLATVTIRATGSGAYSGITIDKIFTLGKSKTGSTGSNGADAKLMTILSDRQTIAYDTAGSPTPSTQTTTFGTNKINTTATVNWSITDASGNAMTPTTTYLSAATGNSITMTEAQFAAARNGTSGVIVTASLTDGVTITDKISISRVQQGATGATGVAGLNNALVWLFQRSVGTPTLPSTTSTYTFSSGLLTGHNNGWTQAVPAVNGNPLWATVAPASSNTTTDNIANTEWAAATTMAQDGATGGTGTAGSNAATVFLFQRTTSSTTPTLPSTTSTYTFATGILTGHNNGWAQSDPGESSGSFLWMTIAAALANTTTDTIANTEWTTARLTAHASTNRQILLYEHKRDQLIPKIAEADARHTQLVARATALSVSTTNVATAQTNRNTLLTSIPVTWNDTLNDSILAVSAYGDFNFVTGWNQISIAAPTTSGLYTVINDNTAVAFGSIGRVASGVTASQTYTVAIVVKRDAVANTTRAPLLRIEGLNGTYKVGEMEFDTSTGAVITINGTAPSAYGVVALNNDEWLAYVSLLLNANNTQVQGTLYPAVGNPTYTAAATGSVSVRDPVLVLGTLDKAGRDALDYRLRAHEEELNKLAKAISEADVLAGTATVTGLGDIIIGFDNTGTAQAGQLDRVEPYRLVRNGSTVTTGLTWTYTVVSGTVNGFTSASGAQSISGAGGVSFTITSLATSEAAVQIKAVDSVGVPYVKTVRVARQTADAPTTGSTGGGTAASISNFASFTATTMATVNPAGTAEFVVVAGGTSVALTASLSTGSNATSGTVSEIYAIFQWWNGAAWADVGTEVASNPDVEREQLSEPTIWATKTRGQIVISTSKTGLTAGTTNRFRLMMRRNASSASGTYTTTGTAGAQG